MAEQQEHQKKRYESDMTRKDKRELEKEKLHSMGWKGKLEYIWAYYKPQMAAILGVILLICFIVEWVDNMKKDDIFYAAVINANMEEDPDLAAADFKAYLGDEDEYHIVTIDTSLQMYGDAQTEYAMQAKTLALIAAGSLDVMICNEENYEHYSEQESFFDMKTEVLSEELYEELKDYVQGDAILIQDAPKWKELGLTAYEPVYLCAVASGKNLENTVAFIEYLFQE
ncbi:MAG: hypothetical protein Q4F41_00390 [Eubacteriales bacterium]|nr:hypothetical protein [Eubacteriales bacterium]